MVAWRIEIVEFLQKNPRLVDEAIELFLWFTPENLSSEIALLILSLLRLTGNPDDLKKYFTHSSRRVQLRARTVYHIYTGFNDPVLEESFSLNTALYHTHSSHKTYHTLSNPQKLGLVIAILKP